MPLKTWGLLALAVLAMTGCEQAAQDRDTSPATDAAPRFAWVVDALVRGNLEPQLANGLRQDGFYRANLGRDWRPGAPEAAYLVTQSRFIYVMAMGYEITGDERYLHGMRNATDFLIERFADPAQPGRWFKQVAPDGQVSDRRFHAYGHTQALFALSHAFKVSGDPRYLDVATSTWRAMVVPSALAGRNPDYPLRGLNVTMHLFEALLAYHKASGSEAARDQLETLGAQIVTRFFDPSGGYFAEFIGDDLQPVPDGEVRLGHNIEMAFLLSRGVEAGLPATYLDAANAAVDFVAGAARRDPNGILPHTTDYAGHVRDTSYGWWSQAELIRGLAHFGYRHARSELVADLDRALLFVRRYFIDPVHGGWYPFPGAVNADKGNEWKAGYHVTMCYAELIRLDGGKFRSGAEVLL